MTVTRQPDRRSLAELLDRMQNHGQSQDILDLAGSVLFLADDSQILFVVDEDDRKGIVIFAEDGVTPQFEAFYDENGSFTLVAVDNTGNNGLQCSFSPTEVRLNLLVDGVIKFQYANASDVGTLVAKDLPTSNPHNAGAVWLNSKVMTVVDNGTQQVETATVAETVEGVLVAGNVLVTVTASGMLGSPRSYAVPVATNDGSQTVAGKIRAALAASSPLTTFFTVSGATDKVVLTALAGAANDGTMNIAIADQTSVGIAAAASSANTTAGAAPS